MGPAWYPVRIATAPPRHRRHRASRRRGERANRHRQGGILSVAELQRAVGVPGLERSNWFSWPSLFWAVGTSLTQALFDGGRCHAQSEIARAGYDAAVASYRQTTLTAFQQVEDNLAALRILHA